MERLLTIKDLCELFQVSQALAYKWVHYGYIPHFKIGSLIRFKESEITRWMKNREKKGRSSFKVDVEKLLIG